jgi:surfeit locus 1 family protein
LIECIQRGAFTVPASIAQPSTPRSPLRGRWLWATVAVAIGFLLLCRLGVWQLQRLQERRDQNSLLLTRLEQPPLTLTGQAFNYDHADLRRAVVRGTYDFQNEVLLRDQELNGVPGVKVITPLRITGSDQAVLVDRGWIPLAQSTPEARAMFDQASGEVEVQGIARASQTRLNWLSPDDPSPESPAARADAWFRVNIPRIQKQLPYPALPVFVQLGHVGAADSGLDTAHLPVPYVELDLSDGPHLGYAIQWFSFALILVAGYIVIFRHETSGSWQPEEEETDAS